MSNNQSVTLNKCKVLKGFCIKVDEFHQIWRKNDQNQYILNKETRQRVDNIIELNDTDMKKALKLKAIEVVD